MMQNATKEFNGFLRIAITGQPGSGGTTLAKGLENRIGPDRIQRISGGTLRRAEAYFWQTFQTYFRGQSRTQAEQWSYFETYFKETYQSGGYPAVVQLLTPYFNQPSNTTIINAFDDAQRAFSPEATIWDLATDADLATKIATANQSIVVESKLAVILDKITELETYFSQAASAYSLPLVRLLLRVDPEVAAARISQREQTPVSVDQVLVRQRDEWRRYSQLYHTAGGDGLTEADLIAVSQVINSTHLSAERVLSLAIEQIITQLHEVMGDQAELAQGWVAVLNTVASEPDNAEQH